VAGTPRSFGTLLRALRLRAGLPQEALAERARPSVDAISALERGARKAPQHQTLALLAEGLHLAAGERAQFAAAAAAARPVGQPRTRSETRANAAQCDGEAAPVRPPNNLAFTLTSFHGRERELAEVGSGCGHGG
jgi:transcriptional regulator with XRE-family HTH domain